jgi:pyruvate/2-oxoglutarate dehydrogenase complex dihydrolipoamide acyltransferase (E2) component
MSIFYLTDSCAGLADARIIQWHVAVGNDVVTGQLLMSVESANTIIDISSPQSGHIVALLAAVGDTIATHVALLEFSDDALIRQCSGQAANENQKTDNGSIGGTLTHTDTAQPDGFIIGRHRHTEGRLQQSAQRRRTRASRQSDP